MQDRPRLNIPTLPHHEAADSTPSNGTSPPDPIRNGRSQGDARGAMIGSRTPWLDLPAPFDNLEIRTWLDYPKPIADLWTPADAETNEETSARTMLACQNTFLDHREACRHQADPQTCREPHAPWEDADGPLPAPFNAEFWERIPTPLYRAIISRFVEEVQESPTSRASRRWKKRSSRRR